GEGAIFHFCKLRRTGERPLFYRKDNRVTITQLTNKADNSYQELSNKLTNKNYVPSVNEYEPSCSINELTPFGDILIAALGKSPMVVTQAYTLFTNSNIKIQKVALVFPKLNGEIENAVRMLEEVFKLKKVDVLKCGVKLADVASKEDCQLFLQRMIGAIDEISVSYPESAIKLLLSGGRKGMTALSYFTAQRSNISDVYHTLITDPQIEKQIEEECSLKILQKLGSSQKKAEKMFLESYQKNNFVLFKIPVIPFIN
ncbi:MAG: CRISPR-associated ring nuclease, partial [Methanosarcinaceae archaeon]